MADMDIALIAAVSENDVIAKNGRVPWLIRDEQALFKKITLGHPIIMGRKTHQSIGRTLPGRLNIVLSRGGAYQPHQGSVKASSLDEALARRDVRKSETVFIIGGQDIYEQALPKADAIYLSKVHRYISGGDRFFRFDPLKWRLIISESYPKNSSPNRPLGFEAQLWRRR